jgi:transcriptional regulator with XRE-family HTH domain
MAVEFKIRVKELLEERGITQKELSDMADVRPAAISALARGYVERISIDHIVKIANALGITDLREILTLEENEGEAEKG